MTDILQINRSIRNILIVALGILLIALLRELAGLLIPLVFAGILALLCIPLVNILRKIGIPKALILIVVALVVSSILVMVINIFINTFSSILSDLDELSTMFNNKISLMTKWAVDTFNVKLDTSGEIIIPGSGSGWELNPGQVL
jgi:AI-2 transport protein TqsA